MQNLIPIDVYAEEFFRLPTGQKIKLFPHQKKILNWAFAFDPETGKLPYQTVVYSCPKKSGKSQIAALVISWFAFVMAELNDTILICANDQDQANGLVYRAFKDSVVLEPALKNSCVSIHQNLIKTKTGVEIKALSGDYAGAAGNLFSLVTFDELWAYQLEKTRRLYEELTPIPTGAEIGRKNSIRFISTYAGWSNESKLLEALYFSGLEGECLDEDLNVWVNKKTNLFMYWDHKARMPWHTKEYIEEQRSSPGFRETAFRRYFYNEWTNSENGLDMQEWDACVEQSKDEESDYFWNQEQAEEPNHDLYLTVGVDAAVTGDSAAVVSVFTKKGKTWLGPMRVWHPSKKNPLDIERTMEAFILHLMENYTVCGVYYDPFQFHRSAVTLQSNGLPMHEVPQSNNRLSKLAKHFTDLLRYKNLVLYEDLKGDLRTQATHVSIKELPDGTFRIAKDKKRKNDAIIALAMAAYGADDAPESGAGLNDQIEILTYA